MEFIRFPIITNRFDHIDSISCSLPWSKQKQSFLIIANGVQGKIKSSLPTIEEIEAELAEKLDNIEKR